MEDNINEVSEWIINSFTDTCIINVYLGLNYDKSEMLAGNEVPYNIREWARGQLYM